MNRHERRAAAARSKHSSGIDIGDATVKYDGRTLDLRVFVNTDEKLEDVVARVQTAAKGPGMRMVVIAGGELTAEHSKSLWDEALPIVKREAAKGGVA